MRNTNIRKNVNSVEELSESIINHIEENYGIVLEWDFIRQMKYGYGAVRNSHSCPLDGVENFSRDDDKPHYYSGFYGWVEGKIKTGSRKDGWFGDMIRNVEGMHTGTFNGASKEGETFSGEIRFFLSDFNMKFIKKYDIDLYNVKKLEKLERILK